MLQHTLIVAEPTNLIDAPVITGAHIVAPLLYQGTGLVADRDNPLVLQILSAHSSAYSYVPDEPIKEVSYHLVWHNSPLFLLICLCLFIFWG
jgi:oligosaccharyltransferase complex subunit beta